MSLRVAAPTDPAAWSYRNFVHWGFDAGHDGSWEYVVQLHNEVQFDFYGSKESSEVHAYVYSIRGGRTADLRCEGIASLTDGWYRVDGLDATCLPITPNEAVHTHVWYSPHHGPDDPRDGESRDNAPDVPREERPDDSPPADDGPVPVVRPGGFDGDPATTERVDTADPASAAIAMSLAAFTDHGTDEPPRVPARYAMLAREDAFADALAGSALAGAGPMLLTAREALDGAVAQELKRILEPGATVFLLGGTGALSDAVRDAVSDLGFVSERLAGPTRVETSVAIADEVRRQHPGDVVALARTNAPGDTPSAAWADSVTGGAWAARAGVPILLTPTEGLHPAVASWMEDHPVQRTVLFGGEAALANAVAEAVPSPVRVAGHNRAGTASEIAQSLWDVSPQGTRRYLVIDGFRDDGWAFGLPAASLSSATGAPVLIVASGTAPPETASTVTECGTPAIDLLIVGSNTIVSEGAREELDQLDGMAC